ncbi:MAG: hypothetical protein U0793_20790 [Gemmataceae bacterium]
MLGVQWLRAEKKLYLTDTTFRDAASIALGDADADVRHAADAPVDARLHADLFSLEMWGGAMFDTSMRFLKEDPWQRLTQMRELAPTSCSRCCCGPTTPSVMRTIRTTSSSHQGVRRGRHRPVPHLRRAWTIPAPVERVTAIEQREEVDAVRARDLLHVGPARSKSATSSI